jgi:hypothetical protein
MAGRKGRMGVKFELWGWPRTLRRGRKVVEPVSRLGESNPATIQSDWRLDSGPIH